VLVDAGVEEILGATEQKPSESLNHVSSLQGLKLRGGRARMPLIVWSTLPARTFLVRETTAVNAKGV
jgi:hypothetical protein